ncbi:MAG: serine/threonine protein kinase [Deltaproteobacteria bacterium]|nr:serine/threonine protein kinase [Deltaproteobacteria bacterium]MBP7286352.1 serine/threonine protein kinase [Nannocystaceae bacterium]
MSSGTERGVDEALGLSDTTLRRALEDDAADAVTDAEVRQALFGVSSAPMLVGRFVTLQVLGRGSFGTVYLAYDPRLDRRVALKVLTVRGREDNIELLREARALAQLEHPNVVTIFDAFETAQGLPAIAMAYVEGVTAHRRLLERDPPPPLREIVDVFAQAALGMAAAHRAGIVHRDFKPDNLMVGADGTVRVTDFGLAVPVSETLESAEALLVGTPMFLPPETFSGKAQGPAGDVYAFGVALFWAVQRRRPFSETTAAALALAKRCGPLYLPAHHPSWLRAMVERATDPDPQLRPSFDAICRELTRRRSRPRRWGLLAGLGIAAVAIALPRGTSGTDCDAAGAAVDEVWAPADRQRLRDALAAIEVEGAREVADRVVGAVDRYTEQWRPARREACWAVAQADPRTVAEQGQRAACLDEGMVALHALLAVLHEADPAMIPVADDALAGMLDVSTCADPDRTRHLSPSEDPDVASDVARARLQLLPLLARLRLTRTAADERALRALLDDPVVPRAPALRAELELRVADYARVTLDLEQRIEFARRGVLSAEEHRLDGLLLESLLVLGGLETLAGHLPQAQDSLARAQAWSRRLRSDPADQAALALARGRLLMVSGRPEAAAAVLAEAAAIGDTLSSVQVGFNARLHLATAHRELGRPQEALAVLEWLERELASDPGLAAQGTGAVLAKQAHARLDLGDTSGAQDTAERALAWLRARETPRNVNTTGILHVVGEVRRRCGRLREAEAVLREASTLTEELGSSNRDVVDDSLARVLRDQERFEEALAVHRRVLEWQRTTFGTEDGRLTWTRADVAEGLRLVGRCDQATPLVQQALEEWEARDEFRASAAGLRTLGQCQAAAGDIEAARASLQRARERAAGASATSDERDTMAAIETAIAALDPR